MRKEVKGYEGIYDVTDTGEVFSRLSNKVLKAGKTKKGYLIVNLRQKTFNLHRLVAQAFIPNPDNLPQVNHIDGDKTNNNVTNLEWCDNSFNQLHALKIGLKKDYGVNSHTAKLTEKEVLEIRSKYIPRVYSMCRLADEYGVSYIVINKIINRKTWKHI